MFYGQILAQHPYYYSINDDNGLPCNEIYYLLQDKHGFVWLGTNEGLYRYDGTDFIKFSSQQQSGRAISNLQLDHSDRLWCQNFSGQIFTVSGDSLKMEFDWSSRKRNFPDYCFDDSDNLWLNGDSGLYELNKGQIANRIPSYDLTGLNVTSELSDLLYNHGRIYYVDKKAMGYVSNGKVTRLEHTNKPNLRSDFFANSGYYKVNGRVLLLTKGLKANAIWEIRNDSLLWQMDLPGSLGRVFALHDDGQGKLWVGSSNGALCLDYNLQPLFNGQLFFPGKSVSDVMLDEEGNYWFSTLQDGLFIVPSTDVWVYDEHNSPMADSRIRQLETDGQGNLYIGYQNGKLSKYNINNQNTTTTTFPNSAVEIQAMYFDTIAGKLLVAQLRTWLVDAQSLKPTFIEGISNIKALAKIKGNRYLLGATLGAFEVAITPEIEQMTPLRAKRALAVYYESEATRNWVGYADGLWVNNIEVRHNEMPISATSIIQTIEGTVWVSTSNQGVLGYRNGELWQILGTEIGLTDNYARKLATHNNLLWIAGSQALISFDLATGKSKAYNRFDGLPSMEITDITFANNKIWLATPKGLVAIPADLKTNNTIAPSIFISGFAVKERDTLIVKAYTLDFNNNNIMVSFKGIAFRSHGEFTYKYRMVGLDSSWITTNSNSNFARYPSLPAGNYTFEVMALNEDGVPSTESAKVSITILRPFWQQWWFYVLCGLAIIALVSAAFVWRIRSLRRKNELEKRMANSQLAALKSQMNPHFMFNALNSIQDLVLQQDTNNAQLYLGKFSDLTRKVLEGSGKEFISLEQEVDMLSLYLELEKLRFGSELRYELIVDEQLDIDHTQIPSMIIQPFVENALKHGLLHKHGIKELTIDFAVSKNQIICTIADNGIGRKASAEINARKKKYQSFATQATTERLRLLNEFYKLNITLQIIDLEQGTKVVVQIPLK